MTAATLNVNGCDGSVKSERMSSQANGIHDAIIKENNNKQTITTTTTTTTASATTMKRTGKRLAEFYSGKTILITGATGFIGKVCLVKLMTSFGNCKRIYVMLRPKKGLTPQQRFNKMLNEAPFNAKVTKMKDESPEAAAAAKDTNQGQQTPEVDWSKVVAVEGNMSSEYLGLADDVKEEVCKNVDIVFNIAASVQFDAPLKQNLRDNYIGVKNLLHLAMDFERLISFVHVSTFYTNSHLPHIEERVIPMNRDCEKMSELITWIPDNLCDQIWPQVMENRPNTYVFTKAMAENLVQKHQGRLPIAIVRPSIVTPSMSYPSPGWVDNVNGPMGLGTLGSLGILRNIDWNYYGVADFIPCDFVVHTMLAVAERTARLHPNEIKVYNCSSSSLNPITWGDCFEKLRVESIKAPPYKMLRIPIEIPKHRRVNPIAFKMSKLSELLFAYFVDFILTICGQKQILTRLTSKLHHGYEILKPFTTTEYTCSNENIMTAFDELDEEDKKEFDFDIRSLDWQEAFRVSYYGARSRLLKEDISNVPAALFKMKILWAVEQVFKILFFGFIAWNSYRFYGYFNQQIISTS